MAKHQSRQLEFQPSKRPDFLLVYQINLAASRMAWEELLIEIDEHKPEMLLISDPPIPVRQNKLIPRQYKCYFETMEQSTGAGCLIRRDISHEIEMGNGPRIQLIKVHTTYGSIAVISCYLQPSTLEGLGELVQCIKTLQRQNLPVLIGGDVNAHSCSWSPSETNEEGEIMEELILDFDLHLVNDPKSPPPLSAATAKING